MLSDEEVLEMELDEELADFVQVALSNGFSKGTANVSPRDYQKLMPLLKHYAKDPHPFTACVRDNRKRFGPGVNGICAVVKDLIYHSTKWRNRNEKLTPAVLSEEELAEWRIEAPDEFFAWLAQVDEEEMRLWMAVPTKQQAAAPPADAGPETKPDDDQADDGNAKEIDGGIEIPPDSANYREATGAQACSACAHFHAHPEGDDGFCDLYGCTSDAHYVSDGFAPSAGGPSGGGAPPAPPAGAGAGYTEDGSADVSLSELVADDRIPIAELFFADGTVDTEDDVIWKTVLREGLWKYSPERGTQRPIAKPITVIAEGKSNPAKLIVSMSEIKANFDDGAVEHVTIPTSHSDGVLENTGFAKQLRMVKDEEGRWVLQAALDFTEPDVREMARRGTVANTSGGILFGYVRKEDGKKYDAVLGHVALTNKPWLSGMKPFGVEDSEKPTASLSFAEATAEDLVELEGLDLASVDYADPGYRIDGVKRLPLGNELEVRHAWAYLADPKNANVYTKADYKKVKVKAKKALHRFGIKVGMSEDLITAENERMLRELRAKEARATGGGDNMSGILDELGLSEDEAKRRLARYEEMERESRANAIKDKVKTWESEGVPPAVLKEAELLMGSDDGNVALLLSEGSGEMRLTATQIVERVVAKVPRLDLSGGGSGLGGQGSKDETDGTEPPATPDLEEIELSSNEKKEAAHLHLEEGLSNDEAIAAVVAKRPKDD
jgi:hypothetical protein